MLFPTPHPRSLSERERLDWLRLARSEGVGPVTFFRLLERHGSAAAALDALPTLAAKLGGRRPIVPCPLGVAEREFEAHDRLGARLIAWGEPDYPRLLATIADPPPLISARGDVNLLSRPTVAVVGARNASVGGQRIAETLAAELGEAGVVVASGLALGIDAAAHRGALAAGTVAVVAGGVDNVYPLQHASLYDAIREDGLVVAESPSGSEPQARHFPRRNRIIAGLSAGVLVVEAGLRSGSLITARLALEEGREVFAVPGSPLDPRSRGGNELIRQGAVLTETADDILRAFEGSLASAPPRSPKVPAQHVTASTMRPQAPLKPTPMSPNDAREAVLEGLGPAPVTVDELVRRCQLSAATVSSVLLELELLGRLERHPGHRVSLA